MPRVPTYDQPTATPDLVPGVRQSSVASPALFGLQDRVQEQQARQRMQGAQQLTRAGAGVLDFALKIQERDDLETVFKQEAALKDNWLQFEAQARQRQGANAKGITQDATAWFDQQHKDLTQNFTNANQQLAFERIFERTRQSAVSAMSGFEFREGEKSFLDSAQASIDGSIRMAANAAIDPKNDPRPVLSQARGEILQRIDAVAASQGWTPEIVDSKKAAMLDKLHTNAIQSMVDTSPGRARAYYQSVKDEVAPAHRAQIQKWFETTDLRSMVQGYTDKVLSSGVSESDAIRQAREKYSGRQEEAIVAGIKVRFSEMRQATEAGQKGAADQAWDAYARSGDLSTVPASVLDGMDGRARLSLEDYAHKKAMGEPVRTDKGTYLDLRQMAASDPDTFQRVDLRQYMNRLSDSDFQEFVKLQNSPDKIRTVAIDTEDFNHVAREIGLDPDATGKDPKEKAKLGELRYSIEQKIDAAQTEKKRQLSRSEKLDIMRGEMDNKVMVDEWGRDPAKPLILLSPDEEKSAYVIVKSPEGKPFDVKLSEIPARDRAQIIRARRAQGLPTTEQDIATYYMRRLKGWK
ncbi:hypothetical protein ABS755_08080 [Castellaniella sp. FW104-16D08]|uniref:hypothetical protein n=1 Tax=unclassified Castellaniella TaxID=2617606 RepID=UPI003314CEC5